MSDLLTRRSVITGVLATAAGIVGLPRTAFAQAKPMPSSAKPHLTVYKDPNCGCCQSWIDYMQAKGYRSTTFHVDLGPIKKQYHVTPNLQSCHTTLVDGLVIEGHIPEADVVRLLKERPAGVIGLTVPGMPASAPGMYQLPFQPYSVLTFDKAGKTTVWARHTKPA
ncbi:MAG: DUF411 domain-containing protein [Acidobacteria bacterium]|nr:DUF411 domain-containing protein [Acidobacteriota bacterium]